MVAVFDPDRFVMAQDAVLTEVRSELTTGHKRTHWMWFVFPQIAGLGSSHMAQRYALECLQDAKLYVAHPVLGPRLTEFAMLVNGVEGRSVRQIFGDPDDQKFHASMTLFVQARPDEKVFSAALLKYFGGLLHQLTMQKIAL
jgi:uncharacterized protein (DUF1810 family)